MQETQIHLSVHHDHVAGIAAPEHAFSNFAQVENRSWKSERFRTSHSSSNDLLRAEFDDAWLARTLATFAGKTKREQFDIAKAYRTYLEKHHDPITAASLYFDNLAAFPQDRFKASKRQEQNKAKKIMEPGEWGHKLYSRLPEPYFYTLSMDNLGLPASYSDSRSIYYGVVIEEIKNALRERILQPFTWKIEVGESGNVQAHAIGPYSPVLDHLDRSKRMQAIAPGTEVNVLAYLFKPAAPWTAGNYGVYLQARAENQASRLSPLSGQDLVTAAPRNPVSALSMMSTCSVWFYILFSSPVAQRRATHG